MRVLIKSHGLQTAFKNEGLEFEVYCKGADRKGTCILTNARIIWCEGQTPREKGEISQVARPNRSPGTRGNDFSKREKMRIEQQAAMVAGR
jgi:hypothetical protein